MKRRFHFFTLLTCLLSYSSQADVGSDMNNFFNGMGYNSNVTSPGVYEGQAAGYYTGGRIFIRSPSRNYQLASALMAVRKRDTGTKPRRR